MKFKFTLQFSFLIFIPIVLACQKDDSDKKEENPKEKISYIHTIKNELNHSIHTFFYNDKNIIQAYLGEGYWCEFYYNIDQKISKEEVWNDEGSEIINAKYFSFNTEGLIDTIEIYDYENGVETTKYLITSFEYNLNRQIVKETEYHPVVGTMYEMVYEYDEKGNQTKMEYYEVYLDTTILEQYVTYEYDTCKNVYQGVNYPFCYSLPKKSIHDYPHLSKINNITRVDVFNSTNELLWYIVYDYKNYTENNYPKDVLKTIYNSNSEILFEHFRYFNYLEY